jgi:hypothetical protein
MVKKVMQLPGRILATPPGAHLCGYRQTIRRFGLPLREGKAAVGRRLIDVPGYTFRIWVTNRSAASNFARARFKCT